MAACSFHLGTTTFFFMVHPGIVGGHLQGGVLAQNPILRACADNLAFRRSEKKTVFLGFPVIGPICSQQSGLELSIWQHYF